MNNPAVFMSADFLFQIPADIHFRFIKNDHGL